MKNIVILPNPKKDKGLELTGHLVGKLNSLGFNTYIEKSFSGISAAKKYTEFPTDAELIVVVGGDGSVIDASHYALEYNVPIIGVNLGKVGYLTEVDPDNLDVFEKLLHGEYEIEDKMLLSVDASCSGETISCEHLAVNDIVISHNNFLGICEFLLENKNGDGVKYRADGVIVSTPEGSTAYSLSAGGPVVSHDVDAIVVTPVCPHSFFNRSIVFKANEYISVTNLGEDNLNICADGRLFKNLKKGDKCCVFASDKKMKMLTFTKNNMFSTLFKKMRILEDMK